jgi:hypothetical protein
VATTPAQAGLGIDQRALTSVIRAMFPHERFPDAPYERVAASLIESAGEDARLCAQLVNGLQSLDAIRGVPFAELDADAALEVLRSISQSAFFESIRAKTILTLYNDPEVWQLLGWEGASYEQGGYVDRGFGELPWLPDPRIEEARA